MTLNTAGMNQNIERTSGWWRVVAERVRAIGRRQPSLHSLVAGFQECMTSVPVSFFFCWYKLEYGEVLLYSVSN